MSDSEPIPLVSVIIPNLNGEKLLPMCLGALKQSISRHCEQSEAISSFRDFEVILVDNGSSDDCIGVAKSILSKINIVSLVENQGFAGAVQRGIEASHGEYIALLNNDAVPDPGWIEAMVRAMVSFPRKRESSIFSPSEADARIGMVACRILNQDGTAVDSLGLGAARNGMAVLIGHGDPSSSPPRYPGGNKKGGAVDQEPPRVESSPESSVSFPRKRESRFSGFAEPFGPSGAAAMYRREMLDQIGGFPERFFCYYEDLWVAWQGRLRGWKCVLAEDAVVKHLGQGTPLSGWRNRSYWITLNKWRTILSCWHPKTALRYVPIILWWDFLALLGDIFSGRFVQAFASRIKAISESIYWIELRKSVTANHAVSLPDCRSWLLPSPRLTELIGRRFR